MSAIKFPLLLGLLMILNSPAIFGQNKNDNELRRFFGSVVLLRENYAPYFQKINGKTYELSAKDYWSKKDAGLTSRCFGTGFIVSRGVDFYLITAEHVARCLDGQSEIKYQSSLGVKKEFKISEIFESKAENDSLNWIRHGMADVAVLYLGKYSKKFVDIGLRPISYSGLAETLSAPDRFKDLTIFGYPLGLGETKSSIAPITKTVRAASNIIDFRRADDNSVEAPVVLLDDASIGGFSGGPVIEINRATDNTPKIKGKEVFLAPKIIGLVHGNQQGSNGLDGFAIVVPSKHIVETLELAPRFSGEYTFYYPNGKIWSERVFKDGLPWTVKSNFDKNGMPQTKGTLFEGNGSLYNWDEEGKVAEVEIYENGKFIKQVVSQKINVVLPADEKN